MANYKTDSTTASDLKNTMTDFSVNSQSTDGPSGKEETEWMDSNFNQYLGYYKDEKTPEITSVIDAKAFWTIGKGFKADEITTLLLDTIRGNGLDTFNTIIENMVRTSELGGNAYCEIIRDDEDNLINLKPLDPAVMKHIVNSKGMITKFKQMSKTIKDKVEHEFDPEDIFYLPRNRIGDEIHGTGIAQKLKLIIDMKNEAMADNRIAMHRNVIPRWKFKLKTDDPTEIAAYKAKQDKATGEAENIYEPFDVSESELISVPPNATLSPLAWIEYLDNLFYEVGGVPKFIVGGLGGMTEAAVKIGYLAFQQTIEAKQLFIEEQVLAQLNLVINLEFPASLENELLSDNKKDEENGATQPNDVIAGRER